MERFLCDQMCGDVGRWLRTAGYDTVIIDTPLQDREIFKQAAEEKRVLLTRDRHFFEIDPEQKTVCFLRGESLDQWAEQLKEERGVDWLWRPFSRCLQCNGELEATRSPGNAPEKVRKQTQKFWFCPTCQQTFWRGSHTEHMEERLKEWQKGRALKIGFGGDLMIGRLVNEFLAHAPPSYIWGDLLPVLHETDLNLVNLEAALTKSEQIVPKVFNFKAAPDRVDVLAEGSIHAVNLANNHILDFSEEGLIETLETLDRADIHHVGAGRTLKEAKAPVILERKGIRVGILGCTDNEPTWKATSTHPGTHFLEVGDIESLREPIQALRTQVDLLILSIHWGPNMVERPPPRFRRFAHQLIDLGVDILHGHSAHIYQGVELYKGGVILYDTGDLVDDYAVDPLLRNDRGFFFIIEAEKENILSVKMIPTLISQFQVNISHDESSLKRMEGLCKELDTHPTRQNRTLHLKQESSTRALSTSNRASGKFPS